MVLRLFTVPPLTLKDAQPPADGPEREIHEECRLILERGAETLQKVKGYQACDEAIRKVRMTVRQKQYE